MNQEELDRLRKIDVRVREIAEDMGLLTTEIMFEIVSAQRVLEGMSYNFPTNFSHWSFGRDYERNRTIYEHTGHGIPCIHRRSPVTGGKMALLPQAASACCRPFVGNTFHTAYDHCF